MKRLLSLVLSVIMLLSVINIASFSTLAATDTTQYTSGDFSYVLLEEGTAEIVKYNYGARTVEIPDTIDGHIVTSIGAEAFSKKVGVVKVIIPDTVTNIGEKAFYMCTDLTDVSIPQGVVTIGNSAFYYCRLKSLTIPKSVTTIGDDAFYDCSITSLTIPCNVKSVGKSAFYMSDIKDLQIEEGVEILGDRAFGYCSDITEIKLPNSIKSIGSNTFISTKITNIEIPANVTYISTSAFSQCGNLERIDVDENNTAYCSIDGVLFDKNLENLICYPNKKPDEFYTIPDGVKHLLGEGFNLRSRLKSVIIPASFESFCYNGFFTGNGNMHCFFKGTAEQWKKVSYNEYDYYTPSVHCENGTGFVVSEVINPTCTTEGYTVYACSQENCTKTMNASYKDALGHNYTVDEIIAPSCTEQGYRSRICSACDYEEKTEYKDALGHTEVVDEAVAKTCTTSGLTEGKHCSVCKEVLTAQQVIDAGHEWTDWQIVEVKQGCKDGLLARMCNDCYEMEQKAIPADIPHTEVIDEAVPPTYTETGLTEGKHCSVCNKILVEQQVVDKLPPEDNTPSFTYGDVNGDGKVNINDATEIQRYIAKLTDFSENQFFAADVDGSTYISINDCTTIQKQLVKFETNVQRNDIPVISGTAPEDIGTAIEYNVDKNKNDHSEYSFGYGTSGCDEYSAVISSYEEYAQLVQTPYPEYDEEFFEENSLIFLFRWTSSGSYRYTIDSLSLKDKTLYMEVDLHIPDGPVTDDIGKWNIYVSVKKSDIAKAEKLYIF